MALNKNFIVTSGLEVGTDLTVSGSATVTNTVTFSNTVTVSGALSAPQINVATGFSANSTSIRFGSLQVYANGALGTAGHYLTSNGTASYWSSAVSQVVAANGLSGGTITTTGTIAVVANTGIVSNTSGLFVNPIYISTLTANNTSFVGTVAAANVVSNTQLQSNLANYQTTAGLAANVATLAANNASFLGGTAAASYQLNSTLSANVATLTANNTSFVGSVAAANVVSNTQLQSNLANYQTTAGLSANVATLTSNNASFLGGTAAASYQLNSTLSANVATLTANNTSFVGSVAAANVVSNTQLQSNLANYQTTAELSANVATLTSNNATNFGGYTWGSPAILGGTAANGATFTTANAANVNVTGTLTTLDMSVSGNLTVSGTTTYINTTNLNVGDNIVSLNADLTNVTPPTEDAGIEVNRGSSANAQFIWDETNDRWSTNGQSLAVSSLIAAGQASGITTLAAGNTTITGFANVTSTIQGGAGLTIAGALSGATTAAMGNTTITGFANVSSTIQGGAGLTIAGALSGVTTAAMGNTTITGFANVSSTLQVAGVTTFNGNVVFGTVGISSNGSFGTAGQVLTTNGSSSYWSTVSSGSGTVTQIVAANGLNGGTITTTGTISLKANNGIVSNTSGVFVDGANGISVTTAGVNVVGNTGIVANTSGVFVAGAVSGVTTLACGNTTITGSANVSSTARALSLGVGTAASATTGEIRATNNITAYYSDKRLKENITVIRDALNKLMSISGVTYNSNDLAAQYGYTSKNTQVGVVAQEVELVLPEIVVPAPFDIGQREDGTEYSLSGENYKTVQYEKLIPLLIEAIKELKCELDGIKAKL